MSAGGAFGGSRGYQPRAPEKGVFPLDHFGECKQVGVRYCACTHTLHCLVNMLVNLGLQISQQYLACLKENANDAAKCRELSKLYLQCRMDRLVSRTAAKVPAGRNAGPRGCTFSDRWMTDMTARSLQHDSSSFELSMRYSHKLSMEFRGHAVCCRNLMAKQDLKELGFRTEGPQQTAAAQPSRPDSNADKQKQGFIAGVRR